jgi:DNA-binding response OmpR family regulator
VEVGVALILAIEDHDEVLNLLSTVLSEHQMLLAPDSTSGLRMAREMQPDLVLLDVGMPDVDGLEVCRALRRAPETADLPVLLVTARAEIVADPAIWGAAGANGALLKPFSPAKLVAMVEELLRERGD